MKNTIKMITREEAEEYIAWHKCENVFIAELDGAKIKNDEDFFRQIEKAFEFPDGTVCVNWDSYLDWICDLGWLTGRNNRYAGFSLFIYNHKELSDKIRTKRQDSCIDLFKEHVLPYWEEDVIHCTCNGHGIPRVFNVFLVNDTKDFMSEIEKGLAYKDNWSEDELKRYVEIFVENGYGRKDWDPDSGEEICYLYTENGGKALIHSKFPIGIANESFLESEHAFGHLFSKEIHIVKTEDFNKELWFIDLEKLKDIAPEIKWIAGPDAVDSASFSALDFAYAVNN